MGEIFEKQRYDLNLDDIISLPKRIHYMNSTLHTGKSAKSSLSM